MLKEMKPEAKFRDIKVTPSGDIKVTGEGPRDYCLLRQNNWPVHDLYGKVFPQMPKENTVDQAVLIFDLPISILNEEIASMLESSSLYPEKIERFNKRGSQEKSTTVKLIFGSKEQKDSLIKSGFRIYHQSFRVVPFNADPDIIQCYRCQKFGHFHRECREPMQKCLRCGGDHRVQMCNKSHEDATCANCSGGHAACYRGCPVYKEFLKAEREKKWKTEHGNLLPQEKFRKPEMAAVGVNSKPVGAPNISVPQAVDQAIISDSIASAVLSCFKGLFEFFANSLKQGKPLDENQCIEPIKKAINSVCSNFLGWQKELSKSLDDNRKEGSEARQDQQSHELVNNASWSKIASWQPPPYSAVFGDGSQELNIRR